MRVLLVDDNIRLRQEVAELLSNEADIQIVGEASNGQQAVELTRQRLPDIVLMDLSMPVMNGLAATQAICTQFPGVRVIGLSMYEDEAEGRMMRKAGAAGYVSKSSKSDFVTSVIAAIRAPAIP